MLKDVNNQNKEQIKVNKEKEVERNPCEERIKRKKIDKKTNEYEGDWTCR